MTYDEALSYYRSFEKFGVAPGLERVSALLEISGNPQLSFRSIHVTGTNGKGSTCTEIAGILADAGYKTALYTSPEVIDFRERMQINGEMISKDTLCEITDKIKKHTNELNSKGIFPTQFEIVTAASFLWFAEEKCDFAVIETGLGGRFDATNIIPPPLVCAVTSVSLDHTAILGDTYEKIAFEKCGIIKKGADVVSDFYQREDVKAVINNSADTLKCNVRFADYKKDFVLLSESITGSVIKYKDTPINVPFVGIHQLRNTSIVLAVCEALINRGIEITEDNIRNGIEKSFIPARTEIICKSPLIILDGSHNDGSTSALAEILGKHLNKKNILAVMGMMADKDCRKSVENLVKYFSAVIAVKPSNPRSMDAGDFADIVNTFGVKAFSVSSPVEGIDKAMEMVSDFDALVICGSLYLAADIRQYLIKKIQ